MFNYVVWIALLLNTYAKQKGIKMPDCEYLQGCPFYQEIMPKTLRKTEELKKEYCYGDKNLCARYIVRNALGKEKVPVSLFPFQTDEAKKIISEENNR